MPIPAALLMDNSTMLLLVVVALALVLLVAILAFRRGGLKATITGPGGTGLDVDGTNQPPPPVAAVRVKGAKSSEGGLDAVDQTGRGADLEDIETKLNINVSSTPPEKDPKA